MTAAGTWLRPREAARYAGVTTPTLVEWTKTRGLEFRRYDTGWRRYRLASLDAILAAGQAGEAVQEDPCPS